MKGIGVSPGISIGKAFVIKKSAAVLTGILLTNDTELDTEISRFDTAVENAVKEIEAIKASILPEHEEDIAILETQIELIGDPQIKEDVTKKISAEKKNASDALLEVIASIVAVFEAMDDEYMRARSADMQDIGNRILKHLDPTTAQDTQTFEPDTIIIAEDLAPSDTITMDTRFITGFATQAGSKTSHAAIIAKAKGIPAVVGCCVDLKEIRNDDVIVLDGVTGDVYINPDEDTLKIYKEKRSHYKQQSDLLKALKNIEPVTTDGRAIRLSANISNAADLEEVFDKGGAGVGLLRTELLFMNRTSFPTEDEQFEFYKNVALQSKGKPIIVRTIDIGGDKSLPYFDLPPELNPFLGYRAIRICLDRKDLFITQLKAILRASTMGDLRIMFPMISNIQEIRQAKQVLEEAKAELTNEHTAFNATIKVGIMIEIPSAAVTADILAKEVDFFSIGTNDLCQYTLAVDRMNEKITYLYDPFNPGVLRLINNVIEQGHKHNVHVGMCGEMAADPLATLLLLGMGLEEFSMSAASIPTIKNIIIKNSELKARQIFNKVMEMDSSDQIIAYLQDITTT